MGDFSDCEEENHMVKDEITTSSPLQKLSQTVSKAFKRLFILDEALDSNESSNEGKSDSSQDQYDSSFISDEETEETMTTLSQMGRYFESVKGGENDDVNILLPYEAPLERATTGLPSIQNSQDHISSSLDSFVVDNSTVEYEEVGSFSQSMLDAAKEIATNANQPGPGGMRLRSHRLRSVSPTEELKITGKKYKRIIPPSDSSSEDE